MKKKRSINLVDEYQSRAKAVGWTVAELCRRADVCRTTLSKWKLRGAKPTQSVLMRLDATLRPVEAALGIRSETVE